MSDEKYIDIAIDISKKLNTLMELLLHSEYCNKASRLDNEQNE